MNKNNIITWIFATAAIAMTLWSCDDNETYAELREKERGQIGSFLRTGVQVQDEDEETFLLNVPGNIKVIDEATFYANDSVTDVSKNEYVLFKGSGVYMQIIRKGAGKRLEEGESENALCRFTEFNIAADSITAANTFSNSFEEMHCQNNYGTISATFVSGLMMQIYGSKAVPSGWIIPLNFIKLGRQDSEENEIAKVRLIVPSTEGQQDAQYNVYPCFYEITYEKDR